jgi:hypothetical protein
MKIEDKAYFAVSPAETKKQVALDIKKEMENLDKTIDKKAKELENTVWGEKWTGSPDLAKKENNKFKQLLDLKNQLQFLNSMLLGDGMSPELVKSSLKNSVSKIQKTAGFSMPVEDKRYFAISPAETEKKIRELTAAWRKLMNVADNLHGMANPSPEIMKRQDQVDADMERIGNQIAELKKTIGVQENVSVRLAKPIEDKAYFARQGFKAKFAATRIWPNDYSEILNANAKYARLIFDRQKIIRANAGRRIKGEQPLEVPAPPTAPEFPFAFADGDYVGLVLGGQANVPKGATVKWAHNANSIKMSRQGSKAKFAYVNPKYEREDSWLAKITDKAERAYTTISQLRERLSSLQNMLQRTPPGTARTELEAYYKTQIQAMSNAKKEYEQSIKHSRTGTKSKFTQMPLLGTILPTADSIAADNSYAKQVEQMKLQVANKELKGLDKRVVGNETRYYKTLNNYAIVSQSGKILWFVVKSDGDYRQKLSRTGTKVKFANRGAFAEASSSPVLGSLLEKKVMPEGGWRAVETDGGALVIAFEDNDIAGNFARRASENGYSATAPMAMAGRFWNVKVQNENKN